MKKTRYAVLFAIITASVAALDSFGFGLIPQPQQMKRGSGEFETQVSTVEEAAKSALFERDVTIQPEGYAVSVTEKGITVRCSDEPGAFYAVKTLEQLGRKTGKGTVVFPIVEISDWPAFRWRGVMLDEARHFFGKEVVMRLLDLMAAYKYNVLHWHITDDQGWRIEIKQYPELVKYGAVRPCSVKYDTNAFYPQQHKPKFHYNNEKYGPYFYTQEDIKEIVAYAKARHIKVVPEIELPGHVRALLAAHPEFSCKGETLARIPRCAWSIEDDVLCAGNDAALAYFRNILDEVCELFPSDVIHIGGDECPKVRWEKCEKCKARIKAEGLSGTKDLQAWIATYFARHLNKRGRRTAGWDEILNGDVPKSAIGMCWRMSSSAGAGDALVTPQLAAARGYDVIVALSPYCYLSRNQGLPDDPYPYYTYTNPLSLQKAYSFDPLSGLNESEARHVIGSQACVWSESIWCVFDLEWKMWPRALALAEVMWTYPKDRDYAEFRARAAKQRSRLIKKRVNCAPLD